MSEEEWSQAYDESGQLYYFNVVTGETTWQLPQSIIQTEQPEGIPVILILILHPIRIMMVFMHTII